MEATTDPAAMTDPPVDDPPPPTPENPPKKTRKQPETPASNGPRRDRSSARYQILGLRHAVLLPNGWQPGDDVPPFDTKSITAVYVPLAEPIEASRQENAVRAAEKADPDGDWYGRFIVPLADNLPDPKRRRRVEIMVDGEVTEITDTWD